MKYIWFQMDQIIQLLFRLSNILIYHKILKVAIKQTPYRSFLNRILGRTGKTKFGISPKIFFEERKIG